MITQTRSRFLIMALAVVALLAALWAGLVRLGWGWPPLLRTLPGAHGPLMVAGVLGTVTGLERAIALGRRWAYLVPVLTGLGALALIAGLPGPVGPLLITLGSLGMIAVFAVIVRRQPAVYTATMGLGAVAWLVGNSLWLAGWPISNAVLWWAGFLVLTIAGERLELGRVLRPSHSQHRILVVIIALFLLGLLLSVAPLDPGVRLSGLALIGLALWLLRNDLARRTVRQAGSTRFIAASLLAGYVWLGVSGILWLVFGAVSAGPRYDAMLHTLFLGFVFSMIFGHTPIILPAVSGRPMTFQPVFYAHLALLHASLVLRIAGDLAGWPSLRQWGGLLNVVALLLFLANTVRASRTAPINSSIPAWERGGG